MILFRQTVAVILSLLFIAIFVVMMLIGRVNSTVGNPDFYVDQLHRADMYDFVYDDVIPVALEEMSFSGEDEEDFFDISTLKLHIVNVSKEAIPTEWLQEQVESSINLIMPYFLGDTEGFKVTIPLKDRVEAAFQALKKELHKDGVFDPLYNQLVEIMINEAKVNLEQMSDANILEEEDLQIIIRTALPPDWLLTQIDTAIDKLSPYLTQQEAHFSISLDISGRIGELEAIVADILTSEDTYEYVWDNLITTAVEDNVQDTTELPLGVEVTRDEIITSMKNVLTFEWYRAVAAEIAAELFAYIQGSQDTFKVIVSLAEHKPAIIVALAQLANDKLESVKQSLPTCNPEQLEYLLANPPIDRLPECWPEDMTYEELIVTSFLKSQETYDYLFDNLISTAIQQNLQDVTELSYEVEVSRQEVIDATKQVLTFEWYKAWVTDITDDIVSYLTGAEDTFQVDIPLAEHKTSIANAIATLADHKLEAMVDSLPECTPLGLSQLLSNPPVGELPDCRPEDMSYQQVKDLLDIDITGEVSALIEDSLPDEWTITEADLQQIISGEIVNPLATDLSSHIAQFLDESIPDDWVITETDLRELIGDKSDNSILDQVREWVQEGLTIDDEKLRDWMGMEFERLEETRQQIATGYSFTEHDLREMMSDGGQGQLQTIDSMRSWLGTLRPLIWLGWLLSALLLVAIGFLGGRHWGSRLIWAATPLAVASIIVLIAIGPLFASMAQPRIDTALADLTAQGEGLQALVGDKAREIAENAVATFISGLRIQAIILLVFSLIITGCGAAWHVRAQRKGD